MSNELEKTIECIGDADLAKAIASSFRDVEEAIALSHWMSAGVSVGHFVEAIRRLIELRLNGAYTPIDKSLSSLNSSTLSKYEQASGDDGYRIHIPRILYGIYGIRNKRGFGHLSLEVASKVDAVLMMESIRWVISEVLRIESKKTIEDTDQLTLKITERRIPLVWNVGSVSRILKTNFSLKEQILILLYQDQRQSTLASLAQATEGKIPYVKRTLRTLHSSRLLEYNETLDAVHLSPAGNEAAEKLLKMHST